MSSYDLELLLGDIHIKLGDYESAENNYLKASNMCPCRFIPLYLLMNLYNVTGEKGKEYSMANMILKKPVKVKSVTVSKIKIQAKQRMLHTKIMYNKTQMN